MGSNKMAQRVKALAAKLAALNLVSRTPTVEGENRSFVLIIFMFVYLSCVPGVYSCPRRLTKNVRFPGARVKDGYEVSGMGTGNQIPVFCKSRYIFSITEPFLQSIKMDL